MRSPFGGFLIAHQINHFLSEGQSKNDPQILQDSVAAKRLIFSPLICKSSIENL